MVSIYILQLAEGKYYVGKTNHPGFRLERHFNAKGSMWTQKYPPIRVVELIGGCDDFDEDKYTIKYMERYGINNVRGGSFCEIHLSDANVITLNQVMRSVADKCYICGVQGHFARECRRRRPKRVTENPDEKCDCPTSLFSAHRRKKCALKAIAEMFDDALGDQSARSARTDEEDDIEKLSSL